MRAMDLKDILLLLLTVLAAVFGWFSTTIWTRVQAIEGEKQNRADCQCFRINQELHSFRLETIAGFVGKVEFISFQTEQSKRFDSIDKRLERIFDKLEHKQNKDS
jgi:hypothetical protein